MPPETETEIQRMAKLMRSYVHGHINKTFELEELITEVINGADPKKLKEFLTKGKEEYTVEYFYRKHLTPSSLLNILGIKSAYNSITYDEECK